MKIFIRTSLMRRPFYRECQWSFKSADEAAVFMWGKDIAAYEFSVGGVWHLFDFADILIMALQIRALQRSYRLAKKRLAKAALPKPAPKLTWRDALPRRGTI